MEKSKILCVAAVLAASSAQADASVSIVPMPIEQTPTTFEATITGLSAEDLLVGTDGRLPLDVRAGGIKLADQSNATNNGC